METLTFKRPQPQQAPEETQGLTFRRPSANTGLTFKRPQPVEENPLLRFENKLKQYEGQDFNRETILQDPDLMGFVRESMGARFKDRGLIAGAATGAAGGATAFGWEKMSDEELLDTFFNYQRSFAGGQTVTTLNEVAFAQGADDATKARLAIGYKLFDRVDNAFVGSGTWGNTFDAVGDYMSAAIWDPTTVIGLGVGRAFSAGGSRAAAMALRAGAKSAYQTALDKAIAQGVKGEAAKAVAKEAGDAVMRQGFKAIGTDTAANTARVEARKRIVQDNISRGMTVEAAEQAANKALAQVATRGSLDIAKASLLKELGATAAVDVAANVGMDIAYQNTLLITGAQEEYSVPQTFVAAVGGMVLPGIVAARTAIGKGKFFSAHKVLSQDYIGKDKDTIMSLIKGKVDLDQVNGTYRTSIEGFINNLDKGLTWPEAKAKGKQVLADMGEKPTVNPSVTDFFNRFMNGYVTEEGEVFDGYGVALKKAGLQFVARDRDDNITNFFGDAIDWMEPDLLERMVKGYEDKMGVKLNIGYTPEAVSAAYRTATSEAGTFLRLGRTLSDLLKNVDDPKARKKILEERGAAYGSWGLSIWKRLVTSHPSTTGMNIKGWGALSLMNTTSDLVQGTLEFGFGTFMKGLGASQAGAELIQKGRGTLIASARRGKQILNWDATLEESEALLSYLGKEVENELFKYGVGESGSTKGAVQDFRIPDNAVSRGIEKTVNSVQAAAGVQLQDEITKLLSFYSAMDRQILRTYGKSYEEFMNQPDRFLQMATEEFQTEVIAKALDRATRETASKSWSDKKGSFITLQAAHIVESISNNPTMGYALPFGRFFNTSVAVLGDFSGANFLLHWAKKAQGLKKEASADEASELFAKGITGWATTALMAFPAMEKIENGLAWNQERDSDGSIKDLTYDFPESFYRIAAQVVGHWRKDGEAPADLMEELVKVYIGNTFRATQDSVNAVYDTIIAAGTGNTAEAYSEGLDILTNFVGGIASGLTRPLDPINQTIGVLSGDLEVTDRRQGNVFYNEATRYLDNIFNLPKEEQRASAIQGPLTRTDLGGVFTGVREAKEPSPAERVMSSIGMPSWKAVEWGGDPEVKNRLDAIVEPILNTYTQMMLQRNPDFFNLELQVRQKLWNDQVKLPSEKKAREMLGKGGEDDRVLSLMREISAEGKGKVNTVLEEFGYSSLSDIAKEEGAKAKLETILYYLKNYDALHLGIK